MEDFVLSAQLIGHTEDIKGVCGGAQGTVVTASRDRTVKVWESDGNSPPSYSASSTLHGHAHNVYCVLHLPPDHDHPLGRVASGAADNTISLWDIAQSVQTRVFTGHTNNVVALSTTSEGDLISGSWDKTVRVWKNGECSGVLEGHQQAVWGVLGLPNGDIVSASGDRTLKIWRNGICVNTLGGHQDVVRQVALVPNVGFASCSNDTTLKLWSFSGDLLMTMEGHENFVYSVAALPDGRLVSAGEDKTVKIWRDAQCVQTLAHPNPLWDCNVLSNGDIVTASTDAVARVWTSDPARAASAEEQRNYDEFLQASQTTGQSVNVSSLPDVSETSKPGESDGQVKMFKENNIAYAYQWSAAEGAWAKIGEVTGQGGGGGGGGGGASGGMLDGVQYDYVFDIDVNGSMYRLGYNNGQDEYSVAYRFLANNELPAGFLDQVADFIRKNSQQFVLGGGGGAPAAVDPLTGGARYIPGSFAPTRHAAPSAGYNPDPFTGGSAARPSASRNDFPLSEPCLFKTGKPDAACKKAIEVGALAGMSADQQMQLERIASSITAGTGVKSGDLAFLASLVREWPSEARFPVIDLLRLAVVAPQGATLLGSSSADGEFLPDVVKVHVSVVEGGKNRMLALRLLANSFVLIGAGSGGELVKLLSQVVDAVADVMDGNKNEKLAYATCLMNYSLLTPTLPEELFMQLLVALNEYFDGSHEEEAVYRALVAFGTMVSLRRAEALEIVSILDQLPSALAGLADGGTEKVARCARALQAALK